MLPGKRCGAFVCAEFSFPANLINRDCCSFLARESLSSMEVLVFSAVEKCLCYLGLWVLLFFFFFFLGKFIPSLQDVPKNHPLFSFVVSQKCEWA